MKEVFNESVEQITHNTLQGELIMDGEFWEYKDSIDECDYMYGGCTITITDKDIEHLKSGKFINFSVNMEYGCVLRYKNEQEKEN